MKFGGTSVADAPAINRFIGIVKTRLENKPVVVVSALSQVTNILTEICSRAANGEYSSVVDLIEKLRSRHIGLCEELFGTDKTRLNEAAREIENLLSSLREMTKAISFLCEISDRRQAEIIGMGELLSNIVVHNALNNSGVRCNKVYAREFIITDNNYLKGKADQNSINLKTPAVIEKAFAGHQIVLTQGFISTAKDGFPSLLGREGSDLTATLIGMALNAEMIEIWTDVDGIHTTDPRKVTNTKSITQMSFEVAEELSFFGAKVRHPLTIQPARSRNIPVRVLNSRNPDNPGTLILDAGTVSEKGIKSVTCKENITLLNIVSDKSLSTHDFLNSVFRIFNKYRVLIDLISISESGIAVAVESFTDIENITEELEHFSKTNIHFDKSQVSVVGEELRETKGIMKKIFSCMDNFSVDMISAGGSDINVSFVVSRHDLSNVMQTLHDELF